MRILILLSMLTALASATDYSAADPPSYVPEKPAAADIALLAKLLEKLQGYGAKLTEPVEVGDGYLTEHSYPESYPDVSKILKLLYAKKPALKTTYKILDRLPGIYGNMHPYGLNPALVNAAYRPPLGLFHPYGQHPLNLPGYAPHALLPGYGPHPLGLPGYGPHPVGLPGYGPLALGLPGYGPSALGLPGYGPPALGLPGYGPPGYGVSPLPIIYITKEVLEQLKADEYEEESADATEAPAPAYASKSKKYSAKLAPVAGYGATKVKVTKAAKAKPYGKATKAVKATKVNGYAKSVSAKHVKPAKVYLPTEAPVAATYDAEASAPAAYAADYTVAATDAPGAGYGVEARAATGDETKISSDLAGVRSSVKNVESSSPEGGESARASLSEHGISSQQTIS